jgi:uncharacterized membrane protein
MAVQEREGARNGSKDGLARALGWFSVGLGAAEIAAPRGVARAVGATGDDDSGALVRVMGVREVATGLGILSRPRPAGWLWARVAGDALDLALLGLTAAHNRDRRKRAAAAIAAVASVTVPDILESVRLSRASGAAAASGTAAVRKAVTIRRPREEVEAAWESSELRQAVDELGGSVRFQEAPGGRGTEVVVEVRHDPPAGALGATVTKLLGRDPATQLADVLRRFKQVVETGEVVRSDSSPEGHALKEHLMQRPAQPRGERSA